MTPTPRDWAVACVAATLLARARQARRKMVLVRFPDGGEALCADGDC